MKRFRRIRAEEEAMACEILAIQEPGRSRNPSDGGFSPTELMEHMAKAEEFQLEFLRKSPPTTLGGRRVRPGFFYGFVLKSFRALKRISSPPMLRPTARPASEGEYARWIRLLDEAEQYVGQASSPEAAFIKMNFLFGTLSVEQYLDFQEAHVNYHRHYFPKT
jgi:hypothetical protein